MFKEKNEKITHDYRVLQTNISHILEELASKIPHRRAVVEPEKCFFGGGWKYITFRELHKESDRIALALNKIGIVKGTRVALMVKPGIDFVCLTYALFKIGAIIIMVDPGMGLENLGKCLEQAEPQAFIGQTVAQIGRLIYGWGKKTIKTTVTLGWRPFLIGHSLNKIKKIPWESYPIAKLEPDETAAILFTSGSTGIAKGAVYDHRIFSSQLKFLSTLWDFSGENVDLATFPLFALFDPALGITTVIPDMDTSRPSSADPKKLLRAIYENDCNQLFGSPALLDKFGLWLEKNDIKLKNIKRVLTAGAPVRNEILQRFSKQLPPDAEIFTPYGATEALPVSNISSKEILSDTWEITKDGGGTCIGKTACGVNAVLIKITDDIIENWSDDLMVPQDKPGEIAVYGPNVTKHYYNRPELTALAKIKLSENHGILHRMGDIGRIDDKGRLWFYGRKSHRVITKKGPLFTIACEAIFNHHPAIFRTALVGISASLLTNAEESAQAISPDLEISQTSKQENSALPQDKANWEIMEKGKYQIPVICTELKPDYSKRNWEKIKGELSQLAQQYEHTENIKIFLLNPGFPVDIRHNAKINREELALWAEKEMEKMKGRI